MSKTIYDKISKKRVICSGTTIGTIHGINTYLDLLCKILSRYNITEVLDQGIHNYIFHLNKLKLNIKLLSNEDNLVNTVGCDIRKLDSNDKIVNVNNDVSYIVHQYDRFSLEYKQRLSSKYDFIKH